MEDVLERQVPSVYPALAEVFPSDGEQRDTVAVLSALLTVQVLLWDEARQAVRVIF